jgi:simple sugar transport system permease protein
MEFSATLAAFQAMAMCGALAGLAGDAEILGVYHALVPNVASGIGLMGLLVALLVRADILFCPRGGILFCGHYFW